MKALTYIEHNHFALPDKPLSREAARRFNEQFTYAQAHYFAP